MRDGERERKKMLAIREIEGKEKKMRVGGEGLF